MALAAIVAVSACVLTLYGFHRALLVALSRRRSTRAAPREPTVPGATTITVQLPIYNEPHVCRRVIDFACTLDWPREQLEVQILDDSDDESRELVDAAAAEWRCRGVDVVVLRRASRDGYKAGALALGAARARGELLAVFDADFVPAADFLRRTAPLFEDPDVGMVQARWSHLNERHSLVTRVQAAFLDAHFVVEQAARSATGAWFNFNGTAGVWRTACVHDAGGWQGDTLSEDVDLSYRAQLRGWRFVYLDDVLVPAELPTGIVAFKAQQRRWTSGLAQAARKLLRDVWRADATVARRAEATFHLASPLASVATTGLGAALPIIALSSPSSTSAAFGVLYAGTIGASAFFVAAQRRLGRSIGRTIALLPFQMALGVGIAPSNVLGCARAMVQRSIPFERTPKSGLVCDDNKVDRRPRARQVPGSERAATLVPELIVELALAAHASTAVALLIVGGRVGSGTVFLILFAVGYTWVAAATLHEAVRVVAAQRKRVAVARSAPLDVARGEALT